MATIDVLVMSRNSAVRIRGARARHVRMGATRPTIARRIAYQSQNVGIARNAKGWRARGSKRAHTLAGHRKVGIRIRRRRRAVSTATKRAPRKRGTTFPGMETGTDIAGFSTRTRRDGRCMTACYTRSHPIGAAKISCRQQLALVLLHLVRPNAGPRSVRSSMAVAVWRLRGDIQKELGSPAGPVRTSRHSTPQPDTVEILSGVSKAARQGTRSRRDPQRGPASRDYANIPTLSPVSDYTYCRSTAFAITAVAAASRARNGSARRGRAIGEKWLRERSRRHPGHLTQLGPMRFHSRVGSRRVKSVLHR